MITNWERFISNLPVRLATGRLNRRQLLKAILASTAVAGFASANAGHAVANAPVAVKLGKEQRAFMLQMSKDIYPHDGFLDDEPYLKVVDSLIKEAETDQAVAKMLNDGLIDLDQRAYKIYNSSYAEVKGYGAREALLRQIETTDFFQKVRGGLLFGIYDNKDLYAKFGYEGSSWEEGGYIDRGFSDMTWLPQDPRVKGDKK